MRQHHLPLTQATPLLLEMLILIVSTFYFLASSVDCFSIPTTTTTTTSVPTTRRTAAAATVLYSEPSDTSSDDYWGDSDDDDEIVHIESHGGNGSYSTFKSSSSSSSVSNLMDLMPKTATSDVSAETRAAITEAIVQLEKYNPTSQPTVSPLLNGVWELKYVGGYSSSSSPSMALLPMLQRPFALFGNAFPGVYYSPGLFVLSVLQKLSILPAGILDLNNLEVAISRSQPRVEACLSVAVGTGGRSGSRAGGKLQVKVVSRLETLSPIRMKETYETTQFQDFKSDIPALLQYSRDIYVTYVDEDLLIVRDVTGVPEVLVRKEKQFSQEWGREPSEVEDMAPPGHPSS